MRHIRRLLPTRRFVAKGDRSCAAEILHRPLMTRDISIRTQSPSRLFRSSRFERPCRIGRRPAGFGDAPKATEPRIAIAREKTVLAETARARPAVRRPAKSGNAIDTAPWCPSPLSWVEPTARGSEASVNCFTPAEKIIAGCRFVAWG